MQLIPGLMKLNCVKQLFLEYLYLSGCLNWCDNMDNHVQLAGWRQQTLASVKAGFRKPIPYWERLQFKNECPPIVDVQTETWVEQCQCGYSDYNNTVEVLLIWHVRKHMVYLLEEHYTFIKVSTVFKSFHCISLLALLSFTFKNKAYQINKCNWFSCTAQQSLIYIISRPQLPEHNCCVIATCLFPYLLSHNCNVKIQNKTSRIHFLWHLGKIRFFLFHQLFI